MKELGYPDRHYLNAAMGWLELGDPREAMVELDGLSLTGRYHPDAMLLRWKVHARSDHWDRAHDIARLFTRLVPEQPQSWVCLSFSLYRMNRPLDAWFQLLPQAKVFPQLSAIPYLLACYAAQAGSEKETQKWLAKSAALGGPKEIKPGGPEISALSGLEKTVRPSGKPNPLLKSKRAKVLWTV